MRVAAWGMSAALGIGAILYLIAVLCNIMAAPLIASSELVVGQWTESPRLRALIDVVTDVIKEDIMTALETLERMRRIETAEGVWLDYLGLRFGLERPATSDPAMDNRFGFEGSAQAVGFDQAPLRGDAANDAVYPLPDIIYRRFVRARSILILGDGTSQTFAKAVKAIDPGAAVQDQRNMTIRIVTIRRAFLELADEIGALPRTAGVFLNFVDRGRFGFDLAGVPFDQGPYSGS